MSGGHDIGIYFSYHDRLRLAREYLNALREEGLEESLADLWQVAVEYSAPWENPRRMVESLLDGEPDPFEEFY